MGIYDQLEQLNTRPQFKEKPVSRQVPPTPPREPNRADEITPDNAPSPTTAKAEPENPRISKRYRDTTLPRHHDTTLPRYHDTTIAVIRKAVRQFGKEAATHRFTSDEKRAIADIIYTYARQGIRTSENEMARIAINFVIRDYKENGANSVLEKVLRELNE